MIDSNIHIIVKYLAGEELSQKELELVLSIEQSNRKEFDEIRDIYHSNIFDKLDFDSSKAYQNILKKLERDSKTLNHKPLFQKTWFRVAASLLLLISIGFFTAKNYHWEIKQTNTTASIQKIILPDGSELMLDKNASISYERTIITDFERKISMSGRAHFHITKDPEHPFTIHSSVVDVTVLGTQFTINENNGQTQIVLEEGRIQLSSNENVEGVTLDKPGMQIILTKFSIVKENMVSPELYASWKENRLSFNQCSVQDVLQFISDSYHIETILENPDHRTTKLFGSAPSDDPYLIINAIGKILNTQIKTKSKSKTK